MSNATVVPSTKDQETSGGGLHPHARRILAVAVLGPFMTQMDSTVVNVSLSTMRASLNATIAATQWVISAYLLALALVLPLNAWLVDRIGAKRLYLMCFSAFTGASLLCGAVHTMPQLITARVLQGVAGGLLAPMTSFMVARVAGRQMARAMGDATVPVLVAPLAGPVLAGAILKYAGWPWLFYINLPVGVVAVVAAALVLPSDKDAIQRRSLDMVGFGLLSPGLACALYGLEEVTHQRGAVFITCGVVLLAAFLWQRLGGPVTTTVMAIVMSLSSTHLPVAGAASFTVPFAALVVLQVLLVSSTWRLPVDPPPCRAHRGWGGHVPEASPPHSVMAAQS